jgi:hypothetical protein
VKSDWKTMPGGNHHRHSGCLSGTSYRIAVVLGKHFLDGNGIGAGVVTPLLQPVVDAQ